eukprot:scaffold16413_cov52-Cyclotella_meneghiniana.AAC.4
MHANDALAARGVAASPPRGRAIKTTRMKTEKPRATNKKPTALFSVLLAFKAIIGYRKTLIPSTFPIKARNE